MTWVNKIKRLLKLFTFCNLFLCDILAHPVDIIWNMDQMRKLRCSVPYSPYLKVQCTLSCSSGLLLWARMMKRFRMVSFSQHSCWLQCWEAPLRLDWWLVHPSKLKATCRLSLQSLLLHSLFLLGQMCVVTPDFPSFFCRNSWIWLF